MSRQHILLCILILICILSYSDAKGIESQSVLINEIAWMGTTTSANDEWVELYNTTDKDINLTGWKLTDNEKLTISLKGSVEAHSFYLLERTDDNSVLNIKADLIYKGALSNAGATLTIYDNLNNSIDQANFPSSWSKGNNTTKQTAERADSYAWQTSKNPNGTPGEANSSGAVKILPKENVSLPELKKTDNKNNSALLAAVITPDLKPEDTSSNNPLTIFIVSLGVILVSGGIILFFKFKKPKT